MKAEISFPRELARIAEAYSSARVEILTHLAQNARLLLQNRYLSGQLLRYHNNGGRNPWRDPAGKYKTSARISRNARAIEIRSYPLNIWDSNFERYGKAYKALGILKKRLPADLRGSTLQNWAEAFLGDSDLVKELQ